MLPVQRKATLASSGDECLSKFIINYSKLYVGTVGHGMCVCVWPNIIIIINVKYRGVSSFLVHNIMTWLQYLYLQISVKIILLLLQWCLINEKKWNNRKENEWSNKRRDV